jgi:hypothetical protein
MVADYKKKTDEELIEAVNQYMEKYPKATRNQIVLHATGNAERVRKLAKENKIKLPKALPKGSNSNWNRYFSLTSETNSLRKGTKYNV